MARPKKTDRPVKITVSVPESVMTRVQLKLFDPLRGRARYGALSGLMTDLLRDWVEDTSLFDEIDTKEIFNAGKN